MGKIKIKLKKAILAEHFFIVFPPSLTFQESGMSQKLLIVKYASVSFSALSPSLYF